MPRMCFCKMTQESGLKVFLSLGFAVCVMLSGALVAGWAASLGLGN